jgi:hypothetical protein
VHSPDGRQLLCLLRENQKRVALYITSNDDGRNWSASKPLPPGLYGDRHVARYAPDGRLVVCFRDTGGAYGSPTSTHFVGWVGRYEDIVEGRDGQYRLKLLHSHKGGDNGYPGLELLPDDTFVATTIRIATDQKRIQSSVHGSVSETDRMAAGSGESLANRATFRSTTR